MTDTWLALVLPPLILVPAMGLLSRTTMGGPAGAELRRKALHVALGLAALAFPAILREPRTVIGALCLVIAWMMAVRTVCFLGRHFGRVLHDSDRASWGEIWFAGSIAGLLLMTTGTGYLYVVPLMIMTLADAAAALVGKYHPIGRLRGPATGKTLSGCATFAALAFVITLTGLHLMTSLMPARLTGVALAVALSTTIAEAFSHRGTDNFTVPLVAWLVLHSLVSTPTGA